MREGKGDQQRERDLTTLPSLSLSNITLYPAENSLFYKNQGPSFARRLEPRAQTT